YPLHVVIVLLLMGALFGLRDAGASLRRRRLLGLGTLLALNALCRLDAAIVSTLIWLPTCAWILRVRVDRRDALTRVLCLSGPLLLGALLTVLSFHAMAGTLVPISGSAKALYAQRYYEASPPLQHALELLRGFRYVHSGLIKNVLSGGLLVKADGLAARGIVWLFLLASGWLAYRVVRSNELAERRSTGAVLLALLAIGEVHMIAVVVQIGHFAFDTQHYYAWMTCSLLLWCVFLALELLRALPGPAVRGVGLSVVGVMLACDGTTIYRQSQLDLAEPRHEDQVLAAARWIDTHLPADARIGAWNAGQLAYFANRRVVNLDGLMNDASFLARLRSGASLCPYLKLEGIRYLADINRSDKSMRRDASWDEATSFRGDFLFEDTQVLFRAGDFYVLRLDRCREGEAQVVL
ncbi:MAG: hypothetical protein JWN48_5822, partial [Myxococcaceae bacterium]|nr:hypothetical protein [Myxococcaceae bacterium]